MDKKIRKFVLIEQHYDLAPGTELDYVAQSSRNLYGETMLIGLHADGFKVEIPTSKVLPHKDNNVFPATEEVK